MQNRCYVKQVLLVVCLSVFSISSLWAEEITNKGRVWGGAIGGGIGGVLGCWVGSYVWSPLMGGSLGALAGAIIGREVGERVQDFFSSPKPQRPEPKPVSGPKPAWGWDFSGFDRPIP